MGPFDVYLHGVIMRAQQEAIADGSAKVEVAHLLLAVAAEPAPGTSDLLAEAGLDEQAIRAALDREFEHSLSVVGVSRGAYDLPRPTYPQRNLTMGTSAKLAMERGFASMSRKKDLRPAHLLLGILSAEVGAVPRALELAGVDRAELLARVREHLS
jgi:D-alanyl-D-alanine carboxypeptidase